MPMSPRLLRPRSAGGDSDVRNYIAAVELADGQALEQSVKDAIRDFILGCKTDNIWSAIKASGILMGARTLSGALTPLVGTAPTNNGPFVSGDYNRKTGLLGDGTTKFLNSNRANNADGRDDQHMAAYVSSVSTINRAYLGAGGSLTGRTSFGISNSTSRMFFANRNTSSAGIDGSVSGFSGMRRTSGTEFVVRFGAATTTVNSALNAAAASSQVPTSDNIYVLARNNGSNTAELYTDARMAFYSIGSSLTLTTLESRVNTLYTAIGAAIP